MTFPGSPKTSDLLRRLIDGGYLEAAGPVLDAIGAPDERLKRRLTELQDEAERLKEVGELLKPDNAYVVAFMSDVDRRLAENKKAMDGAAPNIIKTAAGNGGEGGRQMPLLFTDDPGGAAQILVSWNEVSAEAINSITELLTSEAWQQVLGDYAATVQQNIQNLILRGFVEGWSPAAVVNQLSAMGAGLPVSYANTLIRTLYLNAYRRGTTESYKANADILEYAVRVATLDNRVCMACVMLHGTQIGLDEVVADHWNGRCTSVAKIKGIPLNVPTGQDWFLAQPSGVQQEMMGPAAYAAWQAGKINLGDLVHTSEDPLFGGMVNVASLKSLLGDGASEFYP